MLAEEFLGIEPEAVVRSPRFAEGAGGVVAHEDILVIACQRINVFHPPRNATPSLTGVLEVCFQVTT